MIPIKEVQQAALNKIQECKALAATKGYPVDFRVEFFYSGSLGGEFVWGSNTIRLNLALAAKNQSNFEHAIHVVVPHEIAHKIQRQYFPILKAGNKILHHDHNWQRIMTSVFNLKPDVYHNMEVKGVAQKAMRPYIWACGCQEFKMTSTMHCSMKAGKKKFCAKCRQPLTFLKISA